MVKESSDESTSRRFVVDWSRRRCLLLALSEDIGEPGAEILDAAAVRIAPDLGQIIAVTIISLVLHA